MHQQHYTTTNKCKSKIFPEEVRKKVFVEGKTSPEQSTTLSTHTQESWMRVIQAGEETAKTINTSVTKGKEEIAQTV